jgi:RNA polymerase sigma-70 factor (ECF subfamily)
MPPVSSSTESSLSDVDRSLLERARSGDDKAFVQLVRQYERMVFGFSFKICRNKEQAEETLQDTFVNVFRKLKQFDGKSKFSTWLYSIVTNNCMMKRRKRMLEKHVVSIDDVKLPTEHRHEEKDLPAGITSLSLKETPLDTVLTKELRERLDDAILKLPLEYRLVFILRDIEGQSAEETAIIMKLSIPAVKSRLRRARVFLREQLRDYKAA